MEKSDRIVAYAIVAGVAFMALWSTMNVIAVWPEVTAKPTKSSFDTTKTLVETRWGGHSEMWLAPIEIENPMSADIRSLIIAMLSGMLGASIQVFTSLGGFFGNKTFVARWGLWYFLRVPIGAILGLLLIAGIQGGLPIQSISFESGNPFQIAFLGGLAGLFSRSALDKLEDVFTTLLNSKRNDQRKDNMKKDDNNSDGA